MSKYSELNEFQKKSIELSLDKLFRSDSYFSISTIDKLIKILDVTVDSDIYSNLSLLHCMDYSQMGKDFKAEVIRKTLRLLDLDWIDLDFKEINIEDKVPEKTTKSLIGFLRLK